MKKLKLVQRLHEVLGFKIDRGKRIEFFKNQTTKIKD